MNRRAKDRHNLQLVCRLGASKLLSQPIGGAPEIEGVTENLSRDGILMRWKDAVPLPEPGTSLTVDIELQPDQNQLGQSHLGQNQLGQNQYAPRVMRCLTTVVRVIPRPGGRSSVGLSIEKATFRRARPKTGYDLASMKPLTDRII